MLIFFLPNLQLYTMSCLFFHTNLPELQNGCHLSKEQCMKVTTSNFSDLLKAVIFNLGDLLHDFRNENPYKFDATDQNMIQTSLINLVKLTKVNKWRLALQSTVD